MTELLFSLWPYIAGAAGLLGIYLFGRSSGKASERNKQQADERKAIDKAQEVRNETNKMPDSGLNDALSKWLRKRKE